MSRLPSLSVPCLLAFLTVVVPSVAAQPTFQGVGDLPGGAFESHAYGISGDGKTVVGLSLSLSGAEAFKWTGGVISPLGDLPDGDFESNALGASYDGSIIVGTGHDAGGERAVVWVDGLPIALDGLPGALFGGAEDVSGDGTVIVGWSHSSAGEQAVLWHNGVVLALDDLSTTAFTSRAQAVSADGQVVAGWRSPGPFSFEAFVWTGGTMTGLGFLFGGSESQAFGISPDGQYICGYSLNDGLEAAVWHNGTVAGLGFMPGGSYSQALDMSADGSVVVGAGDSSSVGAEAFIWDARHGIRPLRQVLVDNYGLNLDGWMLEEAHAISDDGRTVAGTGTNPAGESEGWVAYMPPAGLQSSTPATGQSLWRSAKNTFRLRFDLDIDAPASGSILIQEMLAGGAYGPDLASDFTFTVENDASLRPRVLKIREKATTLTHRKWYAIRNMGGWANVAPFVVQYVVQVGDANADNRVLNTDFGVISAAIPVFNAPDDDRRDINGDGRILNTDFGLANSKIPSFNVPKPSGH